MKAIEGCQWCRSIVFIIFIVLIVDFEQGNVCWVYIEKKNTLEDKIAYIMRYVVVF